MALTVERRLLTQSILEASRKGALVLVSGGPKIGKSTVLQQCVKKLWDDISEQQVQKKEPRYWVPVVLPLQVLTIERPEILCQKLWENISETLLAPKLYPGNLGPPKPPKPKFYRRNEPWELLKKSLEEITGASPTLRYGLFIDNLELLSPALVEQLFTAFSSAESFAPRSIVTIGDIFLQHTLKKDKRLRPIFMSVFLEDEAKQLTKQCTENETLSTEMFEQSGRHPYLLHKLCAQWQQKKRLKLEYNAFFSEIFQHLDLLSEKAKRFFSAELSKRLEHEVLNLLIEHNDWLTIREIEKETREIGHIGRTLQILESFGIIESALLKDVPHFRAHFKKFNSWYLEKRK